MNNMYRQEKSNAVIKIRKRVIEADIIQLLFPNTTKVYQPQEGEVFNF